MRANIKQFFLSDWERVSSQWVDPIIIYYQDQHEFTSSRHLFIIPFNLCFCQHCHPDDTDNEWSQQTRMVCHQMAMKSHLRSSSSIAPLLRFSLTVEFL